MFLIYDTETTGLPMNYEAPVTDLENWPRLVQLAWQLHDAHGKLLDHGNYIIKPDGFTIPYNSEKVHGISTERALKEGADLKEVLDKFILAIDAAEFLVGHNIDFDLNIVGAEFLRLGYENKQDGKSILCTKLESVDYCALPGGRGGGYKWPTLGELHQALFHESFDEAHNAAADVSATARCFLELIRIGVITSKRLGKDDAFFTDFIKINPGPFVAEKIEISSHRKRAKATKDVETLQGKAEKPVSEENILKFSHLHVHSQYSILQATPDPEDLVAKTVKEGMPALALTDIGNLFGAYSFIVEARKKKIKPIIGCEFFMTADRRKKAFTRDNPDYRFQQVFLAKNYTGYQNLSRMSSIGYVEGMYGLYPRIDKEVILKYKEGLITTSGGLDSEINYLILNVGERQAENAFTWWVENFGEDFYVQLNRHGLEEERRANEVLVRLARKYSVKLIAANNVHYLEQKDAELQDILLCIQNGEYQSTPVGEGRGNRYGFPTDQYYFKSREEMFRLFEDIPEVFDNIAELIDRIEEYELDRSPLMPYFSIPEGFTDADEYLRYLTYDGAKARYGDLNESLKDRIEFELATIKKMGYPGYFLIIKDILDNARQMGVIVGPGRGSAAGSVVAYCLKITDVDPIAFNLLFERFLNPDRVSLPDIDIDFDEDGRDRLLKWVVEKYGEKRVAQIITFGRMAPKMAIRDIARVKQLQLSESDRLAKLVPANPGVTFLKAYQDVPELLKEKNGDDKLVTKVLECAERLEGTIRNTGTHACGVIIGSDDLIDLIPLSIAKDSEFLQTQFEGTHIQNVGMLKMDFLGLKTLSIIKDAVDNIKISRGITIDIEHIPNNDELTFELYSRGDTSGIFQFESEGMKLHLRALKPNRFEDLIAMNALYRPGPMEYIPSYIERKHGREKIDYDLPEMEEYLQETYGITVYQEQVMLLSQKLAGFTKGDADALRKGIGKKSKEFIDKYKPKFVEGCKKNGINDKIITKIWSDWEAFAGYAFNKSHSTCYAWLSYQTAYLKAHYPAEFMAAVLSRHLNDIKKITFFIDECRHQNIEVLGPDINESMLNFVVNKKGAIRFGMAAVKGIGESAVKFIVEERETNGPFRNIFDFARRVNLRAVNKRSMEALAMAGAFDSFPSSHRAQYFYKENENDSGFLEKVIQHANQYQERKASSQNSLFGESMEVEIKDIPLPDCAPWSKQEQVKHEREVTGFYISGHPLDQFKREITEFCTATLEELDNEILKFKGKQVTVAGMVNSVEQRTSRSGNTFGAFFLEDYSGSFRFTLFPEDYLRYKHLLTDNQLLLIKGMVDSSRMNPNRIEFKIIRIALLAEAIDKFVKEIQMTMSLDTINNELLTQLPKILKKYPGQVKIELKVIDPEEKLTLSLLSRKIMVNASDVLRELEAFPDIKIQLRQGS